MAELPVDRSVLAKDICNLVKNTDLSVLTSKFVRTQMEKKHGVSLGEFRKQVDAMIRDTIEQASAEPSTSTIKSEAKSNGNVAKLNPTPLVSSESRKRPAASPPSPFAIDAVEFSDDGGDIYSGWFKISREFEIFAYCLGIKRRRAAQRPVQRKPAKKAKATKESGGGAKKNTAFTRVCVLSDDLSAILNRKFMRRSEGKQLAGGVSKEQPV
jgi:hypothetical protein